MEKLIPVFIWIGITLVLNSVNAKNKKKSTNKRTSRNVNSQPRTYYNRPDIVVNSKKQFQNDNLKQTDRIDNMKPQKLKKDEVRMKPQVLEVKNSVSYKSADSVKQELNEERKNGLSDIEYMELDFDDVDLESINEDSLNIGYSFSMEELSKFIVAKEILDKPLVLRK